MEIEKQVNLEIALGKIVRGKERIFTPIDLSEGITQELESWSPKNGFTLARITNPLKHSKIETKFPRINSRTKHAGIQATVDGSESIPLEEEDCILDLPTQRAFPRYKRQLKLNKIDKNTNEIRILIYADLPQYYWIKIVDEETYAKALQLHNTNQHEKIVDVFPDLKNAIARIQKQADWRKKSKRKSQL